VYLHASVAQEWGGLTRAFLATTRLRQQTRLIASFANPQASDRHCTPPHCADLSRGDKPSLVVLQQGSELVEGRPPVSAQAGLQRGDVVLSIDGKPMTSTGMLRNTVATAGVGKKVELEIWRKGASRKLSVTLGSMPADKEPAAAPTSSRATEPGPLGMTLAPLDAARRRPTQAAQGARQRQDRRRGERRRNQRQGL
jgi:hypothetical protein